MKSWARNRSTGFSLGRRRSISPPQIPCDFRPRRKLGQHFLVDDSILQRLVSLAEVDKRDVVLEVGAGTGNLTRVLLKSTGRVIAVEKDPILAKRLRDQLKDEKRLLVIQGDILRVDLPPFDKVVSSPPYSISSGLLFFLLAKKFRSATMTFQKEFAQRLVAKPGTRDYGRLTVMLQHAASAQLFDFVPRTAFRPVPKVDSFMVQIVPKTEWADMNRKLFSRIVKALFSQRRRVASTVVRRWLEKEGVPNAKQIADSLAVPSKRVFQLTLSEIEDICRGLDRRRVAVEAQGGLD